MQNLTELLVDVWLNETYEGQPIYAENWSDDSKLINMAIKYGFLQKHPDEMISLTQSGEDYIKKIQRGEK